MLIRRRGRVLLVQCPEGGQWAGLWDFPRFPVHAQDFISLRRELADNVASLTGVEIDPGVYLKTIKHSVTRYRITLDCYAAQYVSSAGEKPSHFRTRWLRPADLEEYPLSSTGRRLANLLAESKRAESTTETRRTRRKGS